MLNVYFTVQKMKRGLPQNSLVKMIKHRKLQNRSEAFSDVLNTFGDFVHIGGAEAFKPHLTEFSTLLGIVAAKGVKMAASSVGDFVLIVSTLEGEECEVARRGY